MARSALSSSSITNSPAPSSPSQAIRDAEEIATLKRTITELEGAIQANRPHKRLVSTASLGRGYRCTASLFQDIATVVNEADRRAYEDGSDDELNEAETEEEAAEIQRKQVIFNCFFVSLTDQPSSRDRTFVAFQELAKSVTGFQDKLKTLGGEALTSYYSLLTKGANDARSDDISTVKKAVAGWLNKLSVQPVLNPDDRSNRGFQHAATGKLLCPIEFDWDDLDVRAKLLSGAEDFDISSSFYVRCLYKHGRGDPENVEEGFLRCSLLVKTFSVIFMSPSSANRVADDSNENENEDPAATSFSASTKATKSSIAAKLGLDSVTPRTIAYAAVMLHFSLTDAPQWKNTYNKFDYELFYNFIIDYFEDVQGAEANKRVKLLLKWWNKQIFPVRATAVAHSRTSTNKLRAQRARREA